MKLKIEFACDNAAFENGKLLPEAARIIRDAATKVEGGREAGACRDINGNWVGHWSLTDE